MPKKRNVVEAAQLRVNEAVEAVIQDGGEVQEDALWDAAEMALDGEPKESIADRIRRNRAKPYQPKGGWRCR